MKFDELSAVEKVAKIKDCYVQIIYDMIADSKKVAEYLSLDLGAGPKKMTPIMDVTTPEMSEERIKEVNESNQKLLAITEESNKKSQAEFDAKIAHYDKIVKTLAGLKPLEHCICIPKELDLSELLNSVVPEFECFIDKAREMAKAKNY